ncbi:enoyl-CoA hydratase-related protein [Bradyrhizobium sp. dw_411]|uniref:enoyl-CoA hydratase/isomerase family protein n=1 Tax=Bradyrhizobium sp. dw_411 TaxID=2720082 RepID=UPI0031FEF478
MTPSADIEISNRDGVAIMGLCRPRVRNAITLAMWEATAAIFEGFGSDDGVRAVILTGQAPDFSVGADINEFPKVRASAKQSAAYEEAVDAASEAIARCPKPVIAAINGYCLGGACHLAMACDFRFARPDAQFGIPAARLSIIYGVRSTDRLRNIVGLGHAKRILYSADQFDGMRALEIGFADRIAGDPTAEALEFALRLAKNAPLSISGAKLILNGLARGMPDLDRMAKIAIDSAADSEDYKEGTRAFAEKRPPVFRGR